mgnify:FL=1
MSVLLLGAEWLAATGLSAAAAVRTFGWFAYQPIADRTFTPASGSTWALTEASITARALDPACILMIIAAALLLWNTVSPRTQPVNVLFERLIAPRLAPARTVHSYTSVRVAPRLGLAITALGVVLHIAGVPLALLIAAVLAFVASFLKAAFGLCLGCQLSMVLTRAGLRG